MKKFLHIGKTIALVVLMAAAATVNAQRTAIANGNWNNTATWGGAAVPIAGQTVTINSGVTVTLNVNTPALTALTINSGGVLVMSANTLNAATINLNGTLTRNGTAGITVTTMTVGATGTYNHAFNGGTIPVATWNAASTCNITGVTSTLPTNSTQTFGNFTWDCLGLTATTNNFPVININGTLTIANTNGQELRPTDGATHNIGGDYIQTGGIVRWCRSTAGTVNVTGNVAISGGECRLNTNNRVGTLNVGGDFSITGTGVLTETSTGGGSVNFIAGTHNFTSGGTVSNNINWTVESGAVLNMAAESTVVTGSSFTVASGGTLGITSLAGITSSGATGNIRTTTRTFNTGGNYDYIGGASQVTGNGLPSSINKLTVNNSAGVSLSNAVTLNDATNPLVLTNGIVTGAAITISSAYTGAGGGGSASSHVNGAMYKTGSTDYTFPVGNGTIYRPISISGLSASATVRATYYLASPQTAFGTTGVGGANTLKQISACEYWDLNDGGAGISAKVGLQYGATAPCGSSTYITDPATLVVAHWNGSAWESKGAAFGTTLTNMTAANSSTFSPFTIGTTNSAANPLPVSFSNVKAFEKGTAVQIDWTNLTESDMSSYVIERSANGIDFTEIGTVAPRSNQVDAVSYSFMDMSPLSGTGFYRIKAVEVSGKTVYTKSLRVNIGQGPKGITLYPNPVHGSDVNVSFSASRGVYQLNVLNAAGQIVYRQQLNHAGGTVAQTLSLPSSLKAGVYSLLVSGENYKETTRFVVQ